MSKVFNMVGGGGGNNISSIVITGLESTDTVTCAKDGKTYPATWDDTAQHWQIVGLPLGTFTVTATNGTKNNTETVLIDIAGVYEIEMSFKLWLYKDGDECIDITGGWNTSSSWSAGTVTKNNDSIKLSSTSGSGLSVETSNSINSAGYTSLCVEVSATNVMSGGSGGQFEVSLSKKGSYDSTNFDARCIKYENTAKIILKTNINSHTNGYVCGIKAFLAVATFYKVWLE